MNALSIAQAVQELGAILLVEHGQEVRAHKAELLIALGVPMDQTVAAILGDLRPYLPQSLRRLAERCLLRSQESVRHRHTVRRTIEGARCAVLHIETNLFLGESAQSAQSAHYSTDGEENGSIRWADYHPAPPESTHKIGPRERPALPQDAAAGLTVPGPTDEVVLRI